MDIKNKHRKRILFFIGLCAGVICIAVFFVYQYQNRDDKEPKQDNEGYYLLSTKEDFRWFISTVRKGNTEVNVRLMNDLILNDTSDWENWENEAPENGYYPIVYYNGHFDGQGYALEGYYADTSSSWQASIFTVLEENAKITNLKIRNSFFRATFEDAWYEDDDESIDIVTAAPLCFSNDGMIEGCDIDVKVMGAWSAGGIVGVNYGQIKDCCFRGSVEGGMEEDAEKPENRLGVDALYVGGICRSNYGVVSGCMNEGSVTLSTLPDFFYMNYAAGGIAGRVSDEGIIENCGNIGRVECVQLSGGIAGANWGIIRQCINGGPVHVEQADWEYTSSLISAGICASNGGIVDTCLNLGSASINQHSVSFYAPVYGIACNTVNPSKGTISNCYYLPENTVQDYRQSGVYKLPDYSGLDLFAYFSGYRKISDTDTWSLFTSLPDYSGTDVEDYIHLGLGPDYDVNYVVEPGDSLWNIAEKFYGEGCLYSLLEREGQMDFHQPLIPGEQVRVPHKDYYLLCANDVEGLGWSYCILPSGEACPTHFIAVKPINWYYGYMDFEAGGGLDAMWPKDKEKGHDAAASDIRILYRFDGNPEGDFFSDWNDAIGRIRRSADIYCGDDLDNFHFYRYALDSGDNLYGFSFRIHRQTDSLECAAFYRVKDGFLAEYIGVAPTTENENVLERVRYFAAAIDNEVSSLEVESEYDEFYGKEGWDFPLLHNPFAIALAYDRKADCSSYMLFTGAQ